VPRFEPLTSQYKVQVLQVTNMTIVYKDAPVRHSPTYRISTYALFKEVKYRTFERPAISAIWGGGTETAMS